MGDRSERRRCAVCCGRRALYLHHQFVHRDGQSSCQRDQSPWFFAKNRALGCRCRRHKKGNPKVAASLCHGGEYHSSVRERIDGKTLCRAWIGVPLEALDDSEL